MERTDPLRAIVGTDRSVSNLWITVVSCSENDICVGSEPKDSVAHYTKMEVREEFPQITALAVKMEKILNDAKR